MKKNLIVLSTLLGLALIGCQTQVKQVAASTNADTGVYQPKSTVKAGFKVEPFASKGITINDDKTIRVKYNNGAKATIKFKVTNTSKKTETLSAMLQDALPSLSGTSLNYGFVQQPLLKEGYQLSKYVTRTSGSFKLAPNKSTTREISLELPSTNSTSITGEIVGALTVMSSSNGNVFSSVPIVSTITKASVAKLAFSNPRLMTNNTQNEFGLTLTNNSDSTFVSDHKLELKMAPTGKGKEMTTQYNGLAIPPKTVTNLSFVVPGLRIGNYKFSLIDHSDQDKKVVSGEIKIMDNFSGSQVRNVVYGTLKSGSLNTDGKSANGKLNPMLLAVFGGVLVLAIFCGAAWYFVRKSTNSKETK